MSMLRPLHVSAGQKWVSALGLVLASAGALCAQHGEAIVTLPHGKEICIGVTLGGTLLASLGRGLADRRKPLVRKTLGEDG